MCAELSAQLKYLQFINHCFVPPLRRLSQRHCSSPHHWLRSSSGETGHSSRVEHIATDICFYHLLCLWWTFFYYIEEEKFLMCILCVLRWPLWICKIINLKLINEWQLYKYYTMQICYYIQSWLLHQLSVVRHNSHFMTQYYYYII